jgi:hypothetical protein
MRPLSVIASALALIAAPLGAQEAASRDTSTDVLILSHDFTFSGEFVRVVLAAGEVYRAEASAPEFSLSLRLLESGQKPLLSREQSREPDPSGRNIIFIYPYTTGTYQVALAEGGPVVSLRVYRDIRASHRRQRMAASAGWEIGGELAFGGHTRYGLADPDFPSTVGLDDGGRAGIGIEGCLSARQGSGAARI